MKNVDDVLTEFLAKRGIDGYLSDTPLLQLLDSFGVLTLFMSLEQEFGISLGAELMYELDTFSKLSGYLNEHKI